MYPIVKVLITCAASGRPELLMLCYICTLYKTNTNKDGICDGEYCEISRDQMCFSYCYGELNFGPILIFFTPKYKVTHVNCPILSLTINN